MSSSVVHANIFSQSILFMLAEREDVGLETHLANNS